MTATRVMATDQQSGAHAAEVPDQTPDRPRAANGTAWRRGSRERTMPVIIPAGSAEAFDRPVRPRANWVARP
jgi:hypothetical protein